MSSTNVATSEPALVSAGDTLQWERYLSQYYPSNGWSINYVITGGILGDAVVSFTTTAANDNSNSHLAYVSPSSTSGWIPGYYVLTGYVQNGTDRFEVYRGVIQATANATTAAPGAPVTTHTQRMIVLLENTLETLAANAILESDVEKARFLREKRLDVERQLAINKELRANEVAIENARNGKPTGANITPQLSIVPSGPALGTWWPGAS